MATVTVLVPVGPGADELERCRDTIASLRAWEPAVESILCIDDGPAGRSLDLGPDVITIRSPLRPGRYRAPERIAVGCLAGLRWAAEHSSADFVMKLDTDALVIAPFVDKLVTAVDSPTVGLLGSYETDCNGATRSFEPWASLTRRMGRRVGVGRRRGRRREIVQAARANGYVWGEHALACALALPRAAVDALDDNGLLADPQLFLGTGLGDDPILSLLVRVIGCRSVGVSAQRGVCGVAWRGLPDTPQRLEQRGFSIIHSVKNDPRFDEADIRAYFAQRRSTPGVD